MVSVHEDELIRQQQGLRITLPLYHWRRCPAKELLRQLYLLQGGRSPAEPPINMVNFTLHILATGDLGALHVASSQTFSTSFTEPIDRFENIG